MNLKELLIAQGVTEEIANKIIAEMPANKLFIASEENLDVRYSKAKEQLEQAKGDLKTATDLVATLKKENADVEALQTKIKEYEGKVTQLETERAEERKTNAIKEALTKAGVNDLDYMLFKLGAVEVDKDGNIVDLESKVKSLKETNPTFFASTEPTDPKDPPKGGYKPIDGKLPKGKVETLDVSTMSVDEINQNWDKIVAQNKK